MNPIFDDIKKNFGFGCMRLPMRDGEVDYTEFSAMTDRFIAEGFNYFDTAHGYLNGKSETALRDCLVARHPRESYVLADKLSSSFFNKMEDIRPLFQKQLEACGVEYFDFYLMHAQNAIVYEKYKSQGAYETALELKREDKIRHIGISFHDKAAVLDKILTEKNEVEFVQLQFNYMDYDDASVQSRLCYEVCRKHSKPVIVMEPIKGGNLVDLPDDAKAIFDALRGGSPASYAIRFAAGFDGVMMVLSGMSSMEQLCENVSFMKEFEPLNDAESEAISKVREIILAQDAIGCTACRYCIEVCPKHIAIPRLFSCFNAKKRYKNDRADFNYHNFYTKPGTRASDCIKCGSCEAVCTQHLNIRELLREVADAFEKQKED